MDAEKRYDSYIEDLAIKYYNTIRDWLLSCKPNETEIADLWFMIDDLWFMIADFTSNFKVVERTSKTPKIYEYSFTDSKWRERTKFDISVRYYKDFYNLIAKWMKLYGDELDSFCFKKAINTCMILQNIKATPKITNSILSRCEVDKEFKLM